MGTDKLKKCIGCTCPNDGLDGKCSGNQGIGCIADWRCCKDYNEVCKDCHDCDSEYMTNYNCDKFNCKKMKNFKDKFKNETT